MGEQDWDPTQVRDAFAQQHLEQEVPRQLAQLRDVRSGRATPLVHQVNFYRRMEQALVAAPLDEGQALACRAGCAYCCHYHVYVYAPEALAIAEHLQAQPAAVRDRARQRLMANAQRIAQLSVEEHLATNVECAFLTPENTCGIYAVRPSACRKHHSYDVQPCITTFNDPAAPDMLPQSAAVIGTAEGLMAASAVAQRQAGFDHRRYELATAVLEALDNKASARRWKDGKVTFPGVRDRDETGGVEF
ncbi:YkgJ family cysteine cluster protein [Ramlibacter alkalitolerans]|uniref:YkgJ family cysteine cluster protein n=1 Tax=Ramlibacter alkalitolerans TaxID=2039631 RepID=A0ABS1JUD6_9BURK|nr:YkgJ family cysteine cluster protein [Ramlibacter alkalitolerans]MBL0427827.1 YkgJ family cysteine cluster protein [Ramlibacter alkalitolerans]